MALMEEFHAVMDRSLPTITEDSMPGELANIVSGRVANILNLRGPNFITDAACASSFAAVEAAVELLTEHKVDAVLTGGVDRNMGASSFVKFCKIGALSATGTRPFGVGADGFVMGEGSGAFLLKRLEDAERAGDTISVSYTHLDPTPFPTVNVLLADLLAQMRPILGGDLIGLYLDGSLALGDFDPATSDVDFIAAIARPLSPEAFDALAALHLSLIHI